jgi:hypothetical protein
MRLHAAPMPGPSMACLSSHASSPIDGQRKGFDAGLVQAAHLELFDRLVCGPADGLHLWRCARVIGPPPPSICHGPWACTHRGPSQAKLSARAKTNSAQAKTPARPATADGPAVLIGRSRASKYSTAMLPDADRGDGWIHGSCVGGYGTWACQSPCHKHHVDKRQTGALTYIVYRSQSRLRSRSRRLSVKLELQYCQPHVRDP